VTNHPVCEGRCTRGARFAVPGTGLIHFLVSLSLRLSLSPKFGLRPKISQKVKLSFVWTQRIAEQFAETKRRTE